MKKYTVHSFLSISIFSSLAFAQSVVDVEELRKSITSNSKFSNVVEEPSLDAKLKELAEKEKNLETRLTSQPEANEAKPAEVSVSTEQVKPQEIIPQVPSNEIKVEVKKVSEETSVKPALEEKKPNAVVQVAEKKPDQAPSQAEKDLANAKAKIAKLSKELDETRSRLIIAETEVERLNASIEQRNRESLRAMNVTSNPPRARINPAEIEPLHTDEAPVIGEKMTSAIPVATVIVQKLSLKVGPSASSSTLMHVNEGTRLPIEGSQGSWYRVVAPSGARAWIPSAGVTIGGG